jgi:transposase
MNATEDQEILEVGFEKWMTANHLSYSSIATICGVSEDIVHSWISQKEIPKQFLECLNTCSSHINYP